MADISKIKTPDGTTYNLKDSNAVVRSGDTMTGMLTAPMVKVGRTVLNVARYIYSATAKETVVWTGIKYVSSSHMPVVKMCGYAYGEGKTTELRVALYIYNNEFYSSRTVTNLGVWNPNVYLFTYTKNSVEYVAIGLEGSIYYNMFSIDVQDEMGNFQNIETSGWTINGYTDTGHIPAIGTNHCVSVNYGIDILNPPKVNGHTVDKDVPSDAVFTDTTYSAGTGLSLSGTQFSNSGVTGVKGNAESSYRTGQVNITYPNIGTVPAANGGTGKTSLKDSANALINALDTGSSDPVDADYYVSQYVNGGTTTTTYHRRPMSALWNYIKGKISSVLGLTVSNYGGTAAKATADANGNNIASTYANQNAFSNVKVGSTTVAADAATDTLELAGSNVTLTPDATNDKVTIGITASNVTTALGNTAVANATAATKLATARTINVGNYASGTATSFDGSANITIPVNTLNTQALVRPNSLRGLADNTLQATVNTTRANRLAFLPADQIIIEKTTDGGTTWVDAGISDAVKTGLFSETRAAVSIPRLNDARSTQCGIRVTISAQKYNVPEGTAETGKYAYWSSSYFKSQERYCQLKEMYFWVTSISDTIGVKVERATGANPNTWVSAFNDDSYYMTGWSGCDYIRFGQGTFGGASTQTSQYWNYRFTFMTKGKNGTNEMATTSTAGYQQIMEIRAYGDTWWGRSNNYMANDHLYEWDYLKNAIFPSDITANNGYLKSTRSGNTVTIGSQNSSYCHISNSANMAFWFNNSIMMENGKGIGSNTGYGPAFIDMTPPTNSAGHGGYIDFHFNKSTSDYTTRIIEEKSGQIGVYNKLRLGANTQSAFADAGIIVNDTRNASLTPAVIDQAANFYFMSTDMPTQNWWSVLHVKGWTGAYAAWEIAGPANNSDQRTVPLYIRTSNANTAWGSWRKLLDSSMLSSATNSSAEDVPATPKAVKAAYDLASGASTAAGNAMSVATGAIYFKVTYSISDGNVVCAAHVYSGGTEKTSDHADSCFVWSMSLNGGTSWVSLGTGKTKTVSAMTVYGGNVKCDFTPAE